MHTFKLQWLSKMSIVFGRAPDGKMTEGPWACDQSPKLGHLSQLHGRYLLREPESWSLYSMAMNSRSPTQELELTANNKKNRTDNRTLHPKREKLPRAALRQNQRGDAPAESAQCPWVPSICDHDGSAIVHQSPTKWRSLWTMSPDVHADRILITEKAFNKRIHICFWKERKKPFANEEKKVNC